MLRKIALSTCLILLALSFASPRYALLSQDNTATPTHLPNYDIFNGNSADHPVLAGWTKRLHLVDNGKPYDVEVAVIEVLRGKQVLAKLKADVPPATLEFLLIHASINYTSGSDPIHVDPRIFRITDGDSVISGYTLTAPPDPALNLDIAPRTISDGWLVKLIRVANQSPILVLGGNGEGVQDAYFTLDAKPDSAQTPISTAVAHPTFTAVPKIGVTVPLNTKIPVIAPTRTPVQPTAVIQPTSDTNTGGGGVRCNDGTYSNIVGRGACSHHGGVAH